MYKVCMYAACVFAAVILGFSVFLNCVYAEVKTGETPAVTAEAENTLIDTSGDNIEEKSGTVPEISVTPTPELSDTPAPEPSSAPAPSAYPTPTSTPAPTAMPTMTPTPKPAEEPAKDTVAPVITIRGLENMAAYSYLPDININVFDDTDAYLKPDISITGPDGEEYTGYEVLDAENGTDILLYDPMPDGKYELKADAADVSGNLSFADCVFYIARLNSSFTLQNGSISDSGYLISGKSMVFEETSSVPVTEYEISVFCNGKLKTLSGEECSFVMTGHADNYSYRYEVYPEVFESDGYYIVTISDKDASGKKNTYSAEFAIDSTAPDIYVSGLANEKKYTKGHIYRISVKDNISLESLNIIYGGITLSYKYENGYFVNENDPGDRLVLNGTDLELSLPESRGPYSISFLAEDEAGNTVRTQEYNIMFENHSVSGWLIPAAAIAVCVTILFLRWRNKQ